MENYSRDLDRAISRFKVTLAKALGIVDNMPVSKVYLNYSRENWVRLLNLQMWTLRYHVDLTFILRCLLREKYKHTRRNQGKGNATLGLQPAMLVGPGSQQWLENAIVLAYPGHENEADFQSRQRSRMVGNPTGKPIIGTSSFQLVKQYREHIEHKRKLLEDASHEFSKPWRDNPWRSSSMTRTFKTS